MTPPRLRVHGIPNCDTVKRARAWLAEHAVEHDWVDFRKTPPSPELLARWAHRVGWESLLNRRGTTWRMLDEPARTDVRDESSAIALMLERPTIIRRPVIEHADDRADHARHANRTRERERCHGAGAAAEGDGRQRQQQ